MKLQKEKSLNDTAFKTQPMTEDDFIWVHGFEVSKAMNILPKTKKVLKKLKKKGACLWERDDSPEGYRVSQQLVEIAGNIGLNCFGNVHGEAARHPMAVEDYVLLLTTEDIGSVS